MLAHAEGLRSADHPIPSHIASVRGMAGAIFPADLTRDLNCFDLSVPVYSKESTGRSTRDDLVIVQPGTGGRDHLRRLSLESIQDRGAERVWSGTIPWMMESVDL